jgi:hypothetical protein
MARGNGREFPSARKRAAPRKPGAALFMITLILDARVAAQA